ncbi:GNAT family N-acetyltransferase [Saccharibacillus sp. CPCC 101409]|uniref:GNAT family N-acetyltransferase n=1 Tax=Saccharibacillus sp. CPCC 101409 TaxID=3058041 RepID=UPI002672D78F|nr:GNAT family N-acetyltransferase [Saccharibacillus sp. CPCC 101409]MDO3413041.1 GNAT family N-acetyltransferase [Saccharibacillus sp. CPCC 101409]
MEIKVDDLRGPEVAALLQDHLHSMTLHSPPESVHALDLDKLRRPEITFWSAWENGELLGCGAIKELDPGHGELKSMKTDTRHLRKGVAEKLLVHIIEEARGRGYQRISLETGSMDAFLPARKLYEKHGFAECGPFGDYALDPYSAFMTKEL